MTSTTSAILTCLCGAITEPGSILAASEIPIHTYICHCDWCRHSTGSLGASFPKLQHAPAAETLAKCAAYNASEKNTQYFCPTCGGHLFDCNNGVQWFCFAGIIEQSPASIASNDPWPDDVIKISFHKFVHDTLDGGFVPFLLNLPGRTIPTWSQNNKAGDDFDLSLSSVLALPKEARGDLKPVGEEEMLSARCRCGGVEICVKRANYGKGGNDMHEERRGTGDRTKYLSYLCACRSCRLATGVSLTPWSIMPSANIFYGKSSETMKPVLFRSAASSPDTNVGQRLKHYWSSEKACRSFCGTCGATVAYVNNDREGEVDLATGILRAEEGSLARRWLDWDWGRCSFEEECVDGEMLGAWKGCGEVMREIEGAKE